MFVLGTPPAAGAILHGGVSGGAREPVHSCNVPPNLKKLWSIREIRSVGLGIPSLGKHRVSPLHTGRTGGWLAAPTRVGTVELHQLGRRHRNPMRNLTSWKNDLPKGCCFSLPSIPTSQKTPGWSPAPGRAMVPYLGTSPTPAWPQHHLTLTLGGVLIQFKAPTRPRWHLTGDTAQITHQHSLWGSQPLARAAGLYRDG